MGVAPQCLDFNEDNHLQRRVLPCKPCNLLGSEAVPWGSLKSGAGKEERESKPYRDSFALSGSHHDSLPFTYGS